jgi:hypothetical protein
MFCPGCGSEERQATQFCRACGTDLRAVRVSLERPDSITASAVTAREEIGRAFADQIRGVDDARDLKRVAEDVLPQIEKFLESPEEKRLRRMRIGVIIASIGLGATIAMAIMGSIAREADVEGFAMGAGAGVVTFFIGLGFLLNALLFTRPRTKLSEHPHDAASQNLLDAHYTPPAAQLRSPTTSNLAQRGSVVPDPTTLHLKQDR